MAREFSRTQRVADQIQRDLAQLIQQDLKDPRLGMVTVSHVKVSKDLGYADVYITVLPLGDQDQDQAIKDSLGVLNGAAGHLRHELARGIKLRIMPHLRFHYDESVERGRHLHSLIEKAYQMEKRDDDSSSEG
ncbi:30S ribosome-binding factor RbfA [Marinobacterium arenosum]|uniref:30S ribosome-binding factor RbfA n=1 Tax=Marinobacterium arenosum TaxID=2862496 RepID=UPI001C9838A7|nr:30S ribosome-binding factor RbfA [Marinobacterium arenosum]MBY4678809.1 30S ribosome-binding factor RbfA [Marinobacterium arenosum]